jgi:hypothetical protein
MKRAYRLALAFAQALIVNVVFSMRGDELNTFQFLVILILSAIYLEVISKDTKNA